MFAVMLNEYVVDVITFKISIFFSTFTLTLHLLILVIFTMSKYYFCAKLIIDSENGKGLHVVRPFSISKFLIEVINLIYGNN